MVKELKKRKVVTRRQYYGLGQWSAKAVRGHALEGLKTYL